jgi:AraC-like DNA-binding protein
MSAEERFAWFMATQASPPPLTSGDRLHWDGRNVASPSIGLPEVSELLTHAALVQEPLAPVFDWARAADSLTFYLNPRLLVASLDDVIRGATGTLTWVQGAEHVGINISAVHPALHVQTTYTSLPVDCVELVPHLPVYDPLLKHIVLVLQAETEAEGVADRLYARSLADALAVHLLRRLGTCRPSMEMRIGGLSKHKLRRTTEYIEAHLDEALSLTDIAAVAQMSPDHFARLFRHATGRTPHQYVLLCRIARAKHLLVETTLPIIDISHQVGFTHQSYFTAVFRKHVSTTPKAYRADTPR